MLFTNSDVKQQLAPSGTFFNNYNINLSNPFLNDITRQQLCTAGSREIGVDEDGNPVFAPGQIAPEDCTADSGLIVENVQLRRRFTELGPRLGDFESKMFQYTAGVRGDINPSWDYDVSWTRGQSDSVRILGNWGSFSRVQQALLAESTNECIDTSGDCVPLNLFGPEGSISQEMLDFINLSALQKQIVVQEVGAASVAGDLGDFRSPMADLPIGVAFGFEHRRVSAGTLSDDASQIQNEILGTGAPSPDRNGSFKLNELYAEILAPLVTDAPGIRSLTFEAGIRHSEFKVDSSQNYQSWKAGLAWEPTDTLRVRTMLQRATRAPNVNELFAPTVTGLSNLAVDPCQGANINAAEAFTPGTLSNLCRLTGVPVGAIGSLPAPAAGQINVETGGNAALGPEKANTLTLGAVWQPAFANDLTLTVDYYRIKINDAISNPSSSDVIEDCYTAARNPGFEFTAACAAVGRSLTGGDLNASDSDGVRLPLTNEGTLKTTGIDLGALYALPLSNGALGNLSFALNVTRVTDWKFQANPISVNRDCLGFYSVSCTNNIYKTKGNLRTTWSYSDFDVSLNWRYLGGLSVEPAARPGPSSTNPNPGGGFLPAFESISSYNYFDLTGAWDATQSVRLTLTVNNLLDKKAPNVGNTIGATSQNSGNTFPQFYDVLGRYYTLGVNVRF